MMNPGKSSLSGVLFFSLLMTSCAWIPFERAGRLLISESEERKIGEQYHQVILDSMDVYEPTTAAERELVNYVEGVFQSVVATIPEADRPDYPFQITLLDDSTKNAFATPGGFVYVNTGILRTMRNEAELAGVLGHEVAHITQGHHRERVAQVAGISLLLQAIGAGDRSQALQIAAGTLASLLQLRFSREAERESDAQGTRYLARAGYHPMGIADYFERASGMIPEFLSTHPNPDNRVELIREQVEERPEWEDLLQQRYRFEQRYRDRIAALGGVQQTSPTSAKGTTPDEG